MPMRDWIEPPKLSEDTIAAEKRGFQYGDVPRELVILGKNPRDPHIAALLAEMPDKLKVTSTTTGPVTQYLWSHGGPVGAAEAAAEIVELARARTALAAYGPNPADEAVQRLMLVEGLSKAEATDLVGTRVQRMEDGHCVAYSADGTILREGPVPIPGREYTVEENALLFDTDHVVTAVVRAIVSERTAPRPAGPLQTQTPQQRHAIAAHAAF